MARRLACCWAVVLLWIQGISRRATSAATSVISAMMIVVRSISLMIVVRSICMFPIFSFLVFRIPSEKPHQKNPIRKTHHEKLRNSVIMYPIRFPWRT